VLPAAVSTLVAAVVHGEPVDATVIGAHRYALYLSVRGSVLPVVASDAVAPPTAVRLAVPSGSVGWGVEVGQAVQVGGGRVTLPGVDLVAVRSWRPARVRPVESPRVGCPDGRRGSHLSTQLELSGAGAESGWLADGIRDALTEGGVARLVGRGAGLTPSGDDALAGALLVAHALGAGPDLADAVRARLAATTAVSAALLDAAADGYAARQVVTLVDAAVAADPGAVRRALPAVLAIGHTSGADTVTGVRAALEARHHREKMNGREAA
jgi:hypothetical protein